MKYVVVRPAKDLAKIYILQEGADVTVPFESWALRTGPQILFANSKMHKVLESHHLGGSYEQGAMYAYSYEELCAIVVGSLGPSDRQRYETGLRESSKQALIQANSNPGKWRFTKVQVGYAIWKVAELSFWLIFKTLKLLGFLIIVTLLIKWINSIGKH